RPAHHAHQDVLRLSYDVRRGAEHADVSRVPGHAGHAAGDQPPRDRIRRAHRARVRLPRQPRVSLRAQALLLPGHAEEFPDHPVRGAAGGRGPARGRSARRHVAHHRHPAAAPRGGRRQARARGDARDRGEQIVQETRLWDADHGDTRSMRGKEYAHDYRYFPEPDLVPLKLDATWIDGIRAALPELPRARRQRFVAAYGLPAYDAA